MALVTHQVQGSYATIPLRPLSWSRGFKVKQHLTMLHMVGKTDRHFVGKHNLHSSVGAYVHGPKVKLLKISSFKGSAQNDESGSRENGSKVSKKSVSVSYIPKDSGEKILETPKVHGAPIPYTSEDEGITGSPAINRLFRKWLSMLRTHSTSQEVDEILKGPPAREDLPQTQDAMLNNEQNKILKVIWCYFLELDATIKIPLLLFVPMYLAINVLYGAEVSKELTPLWILGPLVISFYIKMWQGLWALYVFTFKQTAKVIKSLPICYMLAYSYMKQGKLKKDIRACVLQPVLNIKNLDYKELSRKKLKVLEVWFVDKYLDFVESIWPYYCQTIRFLKRANLI
uniref:Uncharacterized protein LOC105107356 n=3 Tax=Rhizophora mucronata TaxID=61149 RepID=A0A2P2KZK3_RHIMU